MDRYVDPTRGRGAAQILSREEHLPVITSGIGICHLFVDARADLDVIQNAKVLRPPGCISIDTALVYSDVEIEFLTGVVDRLCPFGVSFRA
jgi:glutamate-5-semialdehyde dehydrogenase